MSTTTDLATAEHRLQRLALLVRRMWADEPGPERPDRVDLLARLTELDLTVERLQLRCARREGRPDCAPLPAAEAVAVDDCIATGVELARRWADGAALDPALPASRRAPDASTPRARTCRNRDRIRSAAA
ncbi:MAG: hypothetical protein S0880_01605 [Actinomycetota bacterium]|nr:hypothetical protein [Actinomycetota bacterium]